MDESKKREDVATEFKKMLETPMTQEEANAALTQIDVQKAQLGVIRLQLMSQLNQLDLQLAQAEYDRAIVIRRALLKISAKEESQEAPEETV